MSAFEFTTLASDKPLLSKRITLNDDGTLFSDGSDCSMSAGRATRVIVGGVSGLARHISGLKSNEAITLGALRADLPDTVTVTTKEKLQALNGSAARNIIARSAEYIAYVPGKPAFVLLDYDTKAMPPEVAARINAAGGFWLALLNVLPALKHVGRVTRLSTSSGISRTDTGEAIPGSAGVHIYPAVQDGGDAGRFLKTLHDACWQAGLGWGMIGKDGAFLERSIVDRMVSGGERLAFEGTPKLGPRLTQDAALRMPVAFEGEPADTRTILPDLSPSEAKEVERLKEKERKRLKPEMDKAQKEFVTEQAAIIVEKTGALPRAARIAAENLCRGVLLPDVVLPFDDSSLAGSTVRDVLENPTRFVGKPLADPVEGVSYGRGKAKILRSHDGGIFINSFAHGGRRYELRTEPPPLGKNKSPPPPGAFHAYDLPGPQKWTRLPPCSPFITEPKQDALKRQQTAIKDMIAQSAKTAGARRELERRQEAAFENLSDPTPAKKGAITRILTQQVAAEYGFGRKIPSEQPLLLVSGSQGTGKTADALKAVAGIRERIAIYIGEPKIEKCEENERDYKRLAGPGALPSTIVRGRAQPDPNREGVHMCRKHVIAGKVAAKGISVAKVICPTCPFYNDCGHRDQQAEIDAMKGIGVFFLANESLFINSPAPRSDIVIADERIDPTDVVTVPLSTLDRDVIKPFRCGSLPVVVAAQDKLERVRECLIQPMQLTALTRAMIGKADLQDLVRMLEIVAEPNASEFSGDLPDEKIEELLDTCQLDPRAGPALTLLRAVLREFDHPRHALNGVTFGLTDEGEAVFTVTRMKKLHIPAGAAILALDGTGDIKLDRALFGERMEHVVVRIERTAYVTGTRRKNYSTQSLTGRDTKHDAIAYLTAPSERLRTEITQVVKRMPGPCLVVATQDAKIALHDNLSVDQPTTHFNALRGLNTWEECQSVVGVGALSLKILQLEAIARGYMADDPEPFTSYAHIPIDDDYGYKDRKWPYWATFMRRMADGSLSPTEVPIHPDPRVQRVLEQIRDAEVLQGVDRSRPIFNHRDISLANPLALDITYNRILSHKEWVAGGTKLELIFNELGFLPLAKADLFRVWQGPGKFTSEHDAGNSLKTLIRTVVTSLRVVSLEGLLQFEPTISSTCVFAYRRRGQTGPDNRVVFDPRRHADPRGALERFVGKLDKFVRIVEAPQLEPPAPALVVEVPPARPIIISAAPPPPEPPLPPGGSPMPAPVIEPDDMDDSRAVSVTGATLLIRKVAAEAPRLCRMLEAISRSRDLDDDDLWAGWIAPPVERSWPMRQ